MTNQSTYRTFEAHGAQQERGNALQPPAVQKARPSPSSGVDWIAMLQIVLWFILAGQFNIDNKKAVNLTPAPLSIGVVQLFIGWVFFVPAWIFGIRPIPRFKSVRLFLSGMGPQGVAHCLCHMGGLASMGAGSVAFTHIIKAMEPVTTAVLSIIVMSQFFSIPTYLTLIPIVGGVCLASWNNLDFAWYPFFAAMLSNFGASARAVFAKRTMGDPKAFGENLCSSNIFAVLTIIATILMLPVALFCEGFDIYYKWGKGRQEGDGITTWWIFWYITSSAVFYYLYNEVAFRALTRISQLAHAVANTVKRVYVIGSAVIVFGSLLTWQAAVGSVIAVAGTFLFSICRKQFG